MKRYRTYLFYSLLIVLFLVGCGEDGPAGPAGPAGGSGNPQPIKLLLLGSEGSVSRLSNTALEVIASGVLPIGSEVHYIQATDSVPPLSVLRQYDAVLVWSNSAFSDSAATGNVLANYVDAGGGVVISTYSFKTDAPDAHLAGRIMTPGYSPFANVSVETPHSGVLDVNSLDVPLHPIFNGTDVHNFTYWWNLNYSNPPLTAGADLLAKDTIGNNLVAINANENVIGITIYPPRHFEDPAYQNVRQLYGNACMIVANAVAF
ncbi:MAG: hypothetical protein GTO51_02205 [Candidatus Latescibacteria bacterium]|nr:hypothetical protein [Candidatus Latescibacterota bacterium]NIM22426.1 hypothetical protein [Candidatus Latescibacterota bacterium]NIM64786.1 hypothetical protein [Candidatus Latescibacterota bacterium]NIO01297.1 hypothetical protein [Candidatus Latescibacterota bacterium]NIO27789.1 hypothetical protein [Candidatus Latescibacterota bacterium]